jgi:hypothetical protein
MEPFVVRKDVVEGINSLVLAHHDLVDRFVRYRSWVV